MSGDGGEQLGLYGQELTEGHALARQQLARHGKDRYPTVELQAAKVCAEAGELMDAVLHHHYAAHGGRCTSPCQHTIAASIRKELADTALALYTLAGKLNVNLIECMAELVWNDERDFRPPQRLIIRTGEGDDHGSGHTDRRPR